MPRLEEQAVGSVGCRCSAHSPSGNRNPDCRSWKLKMRVWCAVDWHGLSCFGLEKRALGTWQRAPKGGSGSRTAREHPHPASMQSTLPLQPAPVAEKSWNVWIANFEKFEMWIGLRWQQPPKYSPGFGGVENCSKTLSRTKGLHSAGIPCLDVG